MNGNGASSKVVDVEIGLQGRENNRFLVDLRCSVQGEQEDQRLDPVPIELPFEQLNLLLHDNRAYGQLLAEKLFHGPVGRFFAEVRTLAESRKPPLAVRLRLIINPSAEALHGLRWETLFDPGRTGEPGVDAHLLTSERVYFSRYVISTDYRAAADLDPADMRALVVIASPQQLERWKPEGRAFAEARLVRARPTPDGSPPGARPLAALDPAEVKRAQEALQNTKITWLVSRSLAPADLRCEAPTLDNLINALEQGCDILYLVCHGALIRVSRGEEVCDEPRLWLEDENGNVNVVAGIELAARIRELLRPPRLVVLASCQSAGTGDEASSSDGGALAALGPQLARAGVPAVIAMQGNVKMRTAAHFLPRFFQELRESGQLDRAVARARSDLVHRQFPDSYMPVLFMRLRNGQLWRQGSVETQDFTKWFAPVQALQRRRCVVILGTGLLQEMLGSGRLLAKRWAETHRFPMAEHHCEDLAQVAQYLAVTHDEMFPRAQMEDYMLQYLRERYSAELTACGLERPPEELTLDELMTAVVWHLGERQNKPNPYRILANLPCPLYLVTSPSSVLTHALRQSGKDPQVGYFKWREDTGLPDTVLTQGADMATSEKRPIVYHLFGHLCDMDSVVLTEDDYFDYLLRIARSDEAVPEFISSALVKGTLLFLGFQLDDWQFRIILRSIMNLPGAAMMKRRTHVAVQIDPYSSHVIEPEQAQQYLAKYFEKKNIFIYPRTTEDFLQELQQQLNR